jgi:hypothetical protein
LNPANTLVTADELFRLLQRSAIGADDSGVVRNPNNLVESVAFRIVVVNYAAILFILGSFRPLSVTEFMWVHSLSSPDQRFWFAFLAAA